ncbi:hypothetical protein SAMN04515668_4908 [Hymenobacter arizonensis]|uniref:Uncharacterized protein n=2 Tax=Hymenobacter arizonensis TaxID=1227077 RepID=A0A1I6BQB2_HYMAR|nr:hypothetical protein SAMN04515668_4908 [Hymenobacter arizonensis]
MEAWSEVFHEFQPALWEDHNSISLDHADLVRLAQRVAHSLLASNLDPPIYCADAYYLAKLLYYYNRVVTDLRAELKAALYTHSKQLVSFIAGMANGNCVVERVLRDTRR